MIGITIGEECAHQPTTFVLVADSAPVPDPMIASALPRVTLWMPATQEFAKIVTLLLDVCWTPVLPWTALEMILAECTELAMTTMVSLWQEEMQNAQLILKTLL